MDSKVAAQVKQPVRKYIHYTWTAASWTQQSPHKESSQPDNTCAAQGQLPIGFKSCCTKKAANQTIHSLHKYSCRLDSTVTAEARLPIRQYSHCTGSAITASLAANPTVVAAPGQGHALPHRSSDVLVASDLPRSCTIKTASVKHTQMVRLWS